MPKRAIGFWLAFAVGVALEVTPDVPGYVTGIAWVVVVALAVLWLVAHLAERKAESVRLGLIHDDPESLRQVYGSTLAMIIEQYDLVRKRDGARR